MDDERQGQEQQQDVAEEHREIHEEERKAREHSPDERRPEERGEGNTASEAADLKP